MPDGLFTSLWKAPRVGAAGPWSACTACNSMALASKSCFVQSVRLSSLTCKSSTKPHIPWYIAVTKQQSMTHCPHIQRSHAHCGPLNACRVLKSAVSLGIGLCQRITCLLHLVKCCCRCWPLISQQNRQDGAAAGLTGGGSSTMPLVLHAATKLRTSAAALPTLCGITSGQQPSCQSRPSCCCSPTHCRTMHRSAHREPDHNTVHWQEARGSQQPRSNRNVMAGTH